MSNRKEANVSSDLLVLLDLRERMSDEDHWCTGSFNNGDKRCLIGHLSEVLSIPLIECWGLDAMSGLSRFIKKLGFKGVGSAFQYNDTHNHHQILRLIDKAIEQERGI